MFHRWLDQSWAPKKFDLKSLILKIKREKEQSVDAVTVGNALKTLSTKGFVEEIQSDASTDQTSQDFSSIDAYTDSILSEFMSKLPMTVKSEKIEIESSDPSQEKLLQKLDDLLLQKLSKDRKSPMVYGKIMTGKQIMHAVLDIVNHLIKSGVCFIMSTDLRHTLGLNMRMQSYLCSMLVYRALVESGYARLETEAGETRILMAAGTDGGLL